MAGISSCFADAAESAFHGAPVAELPGSRAQQREQAKSSRASVGSPAERPSRRALGRSNADLESLRGLRQADHAVVDAASLRMPRRSQVARTRPVVQVSPSPVLKRVWLSNTAMSRSHQRLASLQIASTAGGI